MAEFLIDEEQFQQLQQSLKDLSDNIAKWQGKQTEIVQAGFTGLIAALTGADVEEVQQRINALTSTLKPEADALEQTAQSNQPTNEGDK